MSASSFRTESLGSCGRKPCTARVKPVPCLEDRDRLIRRRLMSFVLSSFLSFRCLGFGVLTYVYDISRPLYLRSGPVRTDKYFIVLAFVC